MARKLTLAGLAALVALSGCAASQHTITDVDAEGMANPEVALQRSLDRVGRAMTDLRATRSGGHTVVPAELQRPIVWQWSGPLDQAAKALAERVGYAYVPPGPDVPAMPTVKVEANGTPVIAVLRSIGTQAGNKVALVVDAEARFVQVIRHVS